MNVRVKMHGVLGRCAPGQKADFDLALQDGGTAGDLLRVLAEYCGAPFCDAIESTDPRLPRHIRCVGSTVREEGSMSREVYFRVRLL